MSVINEPLVETIRRRREQLAQQRALKFFNLRARDASELRWEGPLVPLTTLKDFAEVLGPDAKELGTLTLRNDNWRWRIPADATGKIEQTRHQPDGGGPNYSQALEWLGLFDVESRWQQQVADKDESVKLTTGEKLVRTHVVDLSSQAIGQVTDFAIDLKSWRMAYVILISGDGGASAAPEGKRQLAIPLAAFRDGGAGKPWILEVPAAELANIPAIAAGELPREMSPFWDRYLKQAGGDSRRGGLRPPEPTTNR